MTCKLSHNVPIIWHGDAPTTTLYQKIDTTLQINWRIIIWKLRAVFENIPQLYPRTNDYFRNMPKSYAQDSAAAWPEASM